MKETFLYYRVLLTGDPVLGMDQYEWGASIIGLFLVVVGGFITLRWFKRTIKDIVEDLQGSIDIDHEMDSIPDHSNMEAADIKREIKALLTQVKASLTQIKQERKGALEEAIREAEHSRKLSNVEKDYRFFYSMKVKESKAKIDLVRIQLKMIPRSDNEFRGKVLALLKRIQDCLHALHPRRIKLSMPSRTPSGKVGQGPTRCGSNAHFKFK